MNKKHIWVRYDETTAEYEEVWFYSKRVYLGATKVALVTNSTWIWLIVLIYGSKDDQLWEYKDNLIKKVTSLNNA